MMHFNKIDDPVPIFLRTIFENTVYSAALENLEFFSWPNFQSESEEIVYRTLQDSPSILYILAQQIFLEANKSRRDRKTSFSPSLFLSPEEFIKKQNTLQALFGSPCTFPVTHFVLGEFWQINTDGATAFGKKIFEKIHADGALPPEIDKLFVGKSIVSDTACGTYEITAEPTDFSGAFASPFFRELCANETVRSIDISALSVEECAAAPFFKYLLQQKKKLYFYAESYRFANKRVSKHLLWESAVDADLPQRTEKPQAPLQDAKNVIKLNIYKTDKRT